MKTYRFVSILLLALLLCPPTLRAASFAQQALFLSQSKVYAGQTVFIYSVITDDDAFPFFGELRFSDEAGPIGTVRVSLESGRATTVSVPWTPKAGTHTITANLVSSGGEEVEHQEAQFEVLEPQLSWATTSSDPLSRPATSSPSITRFDSSDAIVGTLARLSLPFATWVAPYFASIDAFRYDLVKELDAGAQWAKEEISKAALAPSDTGNTLWMIYATFALYGCAALGYFIGTVTIFYPGTIAAVAYLVWEVVRGMRTLLRASRRTVVPQRESE